MTKERESCGNQKFTSHTLRIQQYMLLSEIIAKKMCITERWSNTKIERGREGDRE